MLPADVKQLIARLDAGSFTAFVEALITLETGRLQMPATNVVMSDALTDPDAGLDARLADVPALSADGPGSAIPAGEVGLQLKTTKKKSPSSFGLARELRKEGPKSILANGGTYVLVTSQDLNSAQRDALEYAVQTEALKVMSEMGLDPKPSTKVWDAQTLAGLCQLHPGPAIEIGLVDFGAARSLDELLESLRAADRPFQTDLAREDGIKRLRERAESEDDDPLLLWLHGDPGAGKTRLVAHALDTDDLRDSVLYVEGAEGLQLLLTRLIRNSMSRGILVIDEVDEHQVATALRSLGGQRARWRVISVKSRTDRRVISEGGRNIVLPPLDADATRRLVEDHAGLPEALARMVAEVASGFPELAFRLADELRADPTLDLVQLARAPHPAELLDRALGDDELRTHLAPIALFTAVGFEDELRYELEAVAEAFNVEATAVEMHCNAELDKGRFVSRAGRYRLVSPLLVAIWLATDLIERTPAFEERIFALPEALQEAFLRQLDYFGPDAPHLPAALARVIRDERFRRPESFNEAAGRLLRASAEIIPTQVAEVIGELLDASDSDDLLALARRDLVWTLQILLWWPETWELAIQGLYMLAQHENESWANNATGEFPAAFTLFLSGSTVPYDVRAQWLESKIAEAADDQLELLANAAEAGLKTHHHRTLVGFRGGGAPTDWQPETQEELIESRRTAWRLLLEIRDRAERNLREQITKQIAQTLRVAYGSDLALEVDESLRSREWSERERADLASGLRDVLQYEKPPPDLRDDIQALHDVLMGSDLDARLRAVLRTTVWDLHADTETIHDVPPLLDELSNELAELGDRGIATALATGRDLDEQDTRYALFRLLAGRLGAARVGAAARGEPDWPALSAAFSVADAQGEAEWADGVLRELVSSDPTRVPELLTFLELNEPRIDLVLDLVEGGTASGAAFARLLFGARLRGVDERRARRVLDAVRKEGNLESALGMLDQWLDEHDSPSPEFLKFAGTLALEAVEQGGGTMIDFYVQRLVESDLLDPSSLTALWEARMANRSGLVDELDRILTESVFANPSVAAPLIFDIVRRGRSDASFGLYTSADLALLSRLAAVTSAETVWRELKGWPDSELWWALHHMDWRGDEPEPLVREFLLSDRLAGMEGEAFVCFFNTLGVVMGPYSLSLERELKRAQGWRTSLAGTTAETWGRDLVLRYEQDIKQHREREAEEDLRLR